MKQKVYMLEISFLFSFTFMENQITVQFRWTTFFDELVNFVVELLKIATTHVNAMLFVQYQYNTTQNT